MVALFARRLAETVVVLLVVGALSFGLFRFVGDPVTQMVGQDTGVADRAALRLSLGLDDPTPVQYARYLWRAANGDFGISYQFRRPVTELFAARAPATIELALVASALTVMVGVSAGVAAGVSPRSAGSRAFMALSLVGVSLPSFLIGVLLIYVFAVRLHWLPSYGRGETVEVGPWRTGFLTASGLRALVLPSITLGLYQVTLVARLVRAEMIQALQTDHVRFARARGLSDWSVHYRHALRTTLVPVVTIVGLQVGSVTAFAIVTETVFQWPGMGLLFIQSVRQADLPVMAAYLLLVAVLFLGVNLIVDLLYGLVDPRIRLGRTSSP